MKIVIAVDSFKGTMSSKEAGDAIARGLATGGLSVETTVVPVADGGEGLVEAFKAALGGTECIAQCHGPLCELVDAKYLLLPKTGDSKQAAALEMASSSGLPLVPVEKRNPLKTSTVGVGQQMVSALDQGAQRLLIGIGGSATNDVGIGMAYALGIRFFDKNGKDVIPCGESLEIIQRIDMEKLDARITATVIDVACDVDNVLLGDKGAAAVYGPQKGASPDDVKRLDAGAQQFADVVQKELGKDITQVVGGGAAGGLGAGLFAFCNATLRPGIELILETIGLEEKLRAADLVISGEGKMDEQTLMGKAPIGVQKLAAKHNVPVIGICGVLEDSDNKLTPDPFKAIYDLSTFAGSPEEAMRGGVKVLEEMVRGKVEEIKLHCES